MRSRNSNPVRKAPDLATAKSAAKGWLIQQSELARQRFMSPGDVKSAVYRQKQAEAHGWQMVLDASGTPDPADYPFLKSRAERLNSEDPDYQAVADEWNARAAAWVPAGVEIEDLYEAAVETVDSAESIAAVEAACRITWPMPS